MDNVKPPSAALAWSTTSILFCSAILWLKLNFLPKVPICMVIDDAVQFIFTESDLQTLFNSNSDITIKFSDVSSLLAHDG